MQSLQRNSAQRRPSNDVFPLLGKTPIASSWASTRPGSPCQAVPVALAAAYLIQATIKTRLEVIWLLTGSTHKVRVYEDPSAP